MDDLTLLEKFQQGWEIKDIHGKTAKDVFLLSNGATCIHWGECVMSFHGKYYSDITCTPPRERRWVNIYYDVESGRCSTATFDEKKVIEQNRDANIGNDVFHFLATLCIERVDGKWQLVKNE